MSGTIISIRKPTSSTCMSRGCAPRSIAISTLLSSIRCAAPDIWSVTALVRTLRSTAFRLTLAIFGFGAVGAAVVLGLVAVQVIKLVDEETRGAITSEAESLLEQYDSGGLRRL